MEESGNGGDGSDGWWLSGSHVSLVFLSYIRIKCNAKIFYDTMKYNKMNDGIFKILHLHNNFFSWVFKP